MKKLPFVLVLFGMMAAALTFLSSGDESFADDQPDSKIVLAESDPVDQLLEAVGTMSSVQLYQTYLNIGFIGDGKAQETYSEDDAKDLLASVTAPLDLIVKQIDNAKKAASVEEDKQSLDRLVKIAGLLKKQGQNLQTFWTSGKEEDGTRFEQSRQESWSQLSNLLGLPTQEPAKE